MIQIDRDAIGEVKRGIGFAAFYSADGLAVNFQVVSNLRLTDGTALSYVAKVVGKHYLVQSSSLPYKKIRDLG